MPTIAIFNQKGGVAKTTTAANLAALWAGLGKRTLLVDMDAQGNATAAFGIATKPLKGVYDLLVETASVEDVILDSRIDNLKILPSTPNLSGLDIVMADVAKPQFALRRALESPAADADYIVIDCPPTLSLPSVNALTAANELIIPTFCYRHAQDGLHATWANVRRLSRNVNPVLRINGILIINPEANEVSKRTAELLRAEFGARIYESAIPGDLQIPVAEESDMPLVLLNPQSPAARAYDLVREEVDARIYGASRPQRQQPAHQDDAAIGDGPVPASSWIGMIE